MAAHALNPCRRGGKRLTTVVMFGVEFYWLLAVLSVLVLKRKPTEREFFIPAQKFLVSTGTQIGVKLSTLNEAPQKSWRICANSGSAVKNIMDEKKSHPLQQQEWSKQGRKKCLRQTNPKTKETRRLHKIMSKTKNQYNTKMRLTLNAKHAFL